MYLDCLQRAHGSLLGDHCVKPSVVTRDLQTCHLLIKKCSLSFFLLFSLFFFLPSFFFFFSLKQFSKQAVEHVQSHLSKKQVTPTLFQVR